MANLKLNNVTALSETGGVATFGSQSSTLKYPSGHIVQVLQTVKTDKESFTGSNAVNTFTLCPGQGGSGVFQQAITITGSNKVLINAHTTIGAGTNGYGIWWAILRGTAVDTAMASCTRVAVGTEALSSQGNATHRGRTENNATAVSTGMTWLDNPGAGTYYYKIGVDVEGTTTGYVNRTGADGNAQYYSSVPSSITLMEVAV
tara:strand:+ start:200 stop:808 length:609 start_codon:yes stop_codon:yes gene_type:complete